MELRELAYFQAAANAGSISEAALALHVTQPTFSRTIANLEKELGQQLFIRKHDGVELTERGVILNRYAHDILNLADHAKDDVSLPANAMSGVIHIGMGETTAMHLIAQAMKNIRERYPGITFKIEDGASANLMELFTKGYFDVLVECELQKQTKFHVLELPIRDVWGVVMRRDDPLATHKAISPTDLKNHNIMVSQQGLTRSLRHYAHGLLTQLPIVSTYNLALNEHYLVAAGMGYLITFQGLIGEQTAPSLCFRPLTPPLFSRNGVLWRKTMPTQPTQAFLKELAHVCQNWSAQNIVNRNNHGDDDSDSDDSSSESHRIRG